MAVGRGLRHSGTGVFRPIKSINSNPGHCLAKAIVDESLVERTSERLMREDLFTGCGVRTLSV